jgi:cell division protein FtsB
MNSYLKSKNISRTRQNQGLAVLSVLIILSIFCLGLFYIVQTNGLVESSYQIRQQKEYLSELEIEKQKLEAEIANWQSPANLERMIESLGLVEADKVIYLEKETTVAVKK